MMNGNTGQYLVKIFGYMGVRRNLPVFQQNTAFQKRMNGKREQ